MSKIQRRNCYTSFDRGEGFGEMLVDDDGEYILHADHIKIIESVKALLTDGCSRYCGWYDNGDPSVNGSHMAYDLVSVMRQVLKKLGGTG